MDRFYNILSLFIGAGMFLTGTIRLSECLERYASRGRSALFRKISDNRFVGYGIGAAATAIIQASAATIVTVIGFVNAGILTVLQASAIMLGAHIGTTSTFFLVSLSFFDIRYLFMSMGFIGALMRMISRKDRIIKIADVFISFGILFVGLNLMSGALRNTAELRDFFINIFRIIEFPPLLIFLGMLFTVILQSSTASTSLFLMMIGEGLLAFENAMFLGMGAVIGTSLTPIIAAMAAKTRAKQAGLLNFLFSLIGVTILTGLLWPLKPIIVPIFENAVALTWRFPVFLFSYHFLAASILIWFIKPLSALVSVILKEKPKREKKKAPRTIYIDDILLSTPSLAVDQTKKEIKNMMDKTRANFVLAYNALVNHDLTKRKKIKKQENNIDFLNKAIGKFIVKLSSSDLSESEKVLVGSYVYVINDVERVGDYAYNLIKAAKRMNKNNYKFSKNAAKHLQDMFSKVLELFDLSMEIFDNRDLGKKNEIFSLEKDIDMLKSKMALGHIMWFKAGHYISAGGQYFYTAVSDLKNMADHLAYIAHSVDPYYEREADDPDDFEADELAEDFEAVEETD